MHKNYGDNSTELFAPPKPVGGPSSSPSYVLSVDMNKDGKPDLVETNSGSYRVLLNDSLNIPLTDKTPPSSAHTCTPGVNGNGWNNTDVTCSLSAEDNIDGSGVEEIRYQINGAPETSLPIPAFTLEGEYSISYYAVDRAGNVGNKKSFTLKLDRTAPEIIPSVSPLSNASGWNNTDVTVSFACEDVLSGVKTCATPTTLTSEGLNQQVSAMATDLAGNSTAVTKTINIDRTVPVILSSVSFLPNSNGWNNTDVTVSFNCSDELSGVQACEGPITLTQEGTGLNASGSVIDLAGNSAKVNKIINIDKTAPSLSTSVTPLPNAAGWHKEDVTLSFTCADNLNGAGMESCSLPLLVNTEGRAQIYEGQAIDLAGNENTVTQSVSLDKTAPSVIPPQDITVIATGVLTPVSIGRANATDAMGPVFLTHDPHGPFPFGGSNVTWTAVDKAGNEGTAIQKNTVSDPTEISLEKAEVDWDSETFKFYGAITLPSWITHSGLTPTGNVSVDLALLGTVVNQPVNFTVKGDNGNKWEYKNKAASNGLTDYKISWQGAKFEYNQEIKIKSEHIGADSATLEIEKKSFVGALTIIIGDYQIRIDELGAVSVTPENALEIDIDEDGEIEVGLPVSLSSSTVIRVVPGWDTPIRYTTCQLLH